MKFSVEDFFSKCEFLQFPADLVTFTEEILNEKFHFCAVESALILNIGKHRALHYSSKTYFRVRSDQALCFNILRKARYIYMYYIYMYIYIYLYIYIIYIFVYIYNIYICIYIYIYIYIYTHTRDLR